MYVDYILMYKRFIERIQIYQQNSNIAEFAIISLFSFHESNFEDVLHLSNGAAINLMNS